jgi:hypothetical protein
MADVAALAAARTVRHLTVGASLRDRVPAGTGSPAPVTAGARETRVGLAVLRDVALAGGLVHDVTPDLDEALSVARVREGVTGLALVQAGATHLVKALVWAVAAAAKPAKVPAVH